MKGNVLGIALIALGILSLFGGLDAIFGGLFLFAVAAAFFVGYFRGKHPVGLLIPACIITAVGLFSMVESILFDLIEASVFFAFLGSAFVGIHTIHKMHTEKSTKWAMNVGLGLYAFGAFVFVIEVLEFPLIAWAMPYVWPVALIGGGLLLLVKSKKEA